MQKINRSAVQVKSMPPVVVRHVDDVLVADGLEGTRSDFARVLGLNKFNPKTRAPLPKLKRQTSLTDSCRHRSLLEEPLGQGEPGVGSPLRWRSTGL